jgi:hypothetical protein
MKRREFVERLGLGSAVLLSGTTLGHGSDRREATAASHAHHGDQVNGPLASATVSFGQWMSANRFPNLNPRTLNQHLLIPYKPTIVQGGSVNFIIAGFHNVAIYQPGTQTTDIDTTLTRPVTNPPPAPPGAPPFPPLIDDPNGRVYWGLDPSTQATQDRVEVVTFAEPGTYLVICAFSPHFLNDNMHGFVRVLGRNFLD